MILNRKQKYLLAILCGLSPAVFGQGLINNGAHITIRSNTHLVVTQNFQNKKDGKVTSSGTTHVREDWINDGTTPVYTSNDGTTILDGNTQKITGSNRTSFNNLQLTGSGTKIMEIDVLTGGGFSGGGAGILDLGTRNLVMNSHRLIINNPGTIGIVENGGGILGETDPTQGYSVVQWNIRATGFRLLTVPFVTGNGIPIPYTFNLSAPGTQAVDSGFVEIATYPTATTNTPNNRPLPTGVSNLNNVYGVENDILVLDRFWVLGSAGFTSKPRLSFTAGYRESEWDQSNGSRNDIVEKEMRWVRFEGSANAWNYPGGGNITESTNRANSDAMNQFDGMWMLSAVPYCPVADYNFNEECFYTPVAFTDVSTIRDGSIDSFVWDAPSKRYRTQNMSHQFPTYGTYTVSLKVRSDLGCWDSTSREVLIHPAPTSDFTYLDTCLNTITKFTDRSTTPTGNIQPNDKRWSVDPGVVLSGNAISYQYNSTGLKRITLITENNWGCLDTITQFIEVQPPPVAAFMVDSICEESIAFFEDQSTSKGQITSWQWDLNIATSTDQNPEQQYMLQGNYPISLVVMNQYGCYDTTAGNLWVRPKSRASFRFSPLEIFRSEPEVTFVDESKSATMWDWFFGDGNAASGNPVVKHSYTDTGYFSVELIVNSEANCPDTATRQVYIAPDVKVFIPNVFTPQGEDDLNSHFRPVGEISGLKEFTMEIYNRWGEKIYESSKISEPWDGMYLGKPVPQESYLYIIRTLDIYDNEVWYNGTVTVLR